MAILTWDDLAARLRNPPAGARIEADADAFRLIAPSGAIALEIRREDCTRAQWRKLRRALPPGAEKS